MTRKTRENTTAKPAKRKRGRPSKASAASGGLSVADQIFIEKLKNPIASNIEIARKIGINESTVRGHLERGLKNRIESALVEKYRGEIKVLRSKAFKRLHEMLDDSETPPAVVCSLCKFLLERFIQIEDMHSSGDEILEFETVISESGTINQIKRVYNANNADPADGSHDGERIEKGCCIDVEAENKSQD